MSGRQQESLPVGWTSAPIRDLVRGLQYGYTARAEAGRDGVRFLRITDINSGRVDWPTVPGCHIERDDLEKFRLAHGDLVFARTGSIEKACMVQHPPDAVFASYLIRGRPRDAGLGPWLNAFVASFLYVNQARAASAGIGRANINAESIGQIELSLPPLPEQHRIVEAIESYFTRLDDAVATLERVQRNLTRYRASVLKAAVEGRLVPTEAELARTEGRDYEPASVLLERILAERRRRHETGDRGKYTEPVAPDTSGLPGMPEGWCWASIDQVGDVSGGLTKNAKRAAHDRIVPYLRVANVYADELRLDDVSEIGIRDPEMDKLLLKKGDLLVVEGNGSIDQIGRVAVWDGSINGCVHQNHLIKVRFCLVSMGAWALRWLLSPGGRRAIEREASSTSGLHTLSISKVARLPIPLCPLAEQGRITSEVERLLSVASASSEISQSNEKRAARLRQSILKWAFEGKLADQDPSDEPATALLERIRSQTLASRLSAGDTGDRRRGQSGTRSSVRAENKP